MQWLGFEIHPETPDQGISISKLPWKIDAGAMIRHLNQLGSQVGITFNEITRLPNSRMALEAAEYAREQGKFDAFHQALFESYFVRGENIGDSKVLREIAGEMGLDEGAMEHALLDGIYVPVLRQVKQEAAQLGVTAAPTFIIEGRERIVGAQPLEVFRKLLGD